MSSSHRTAQRHNTMFPIGALVYSEVVYRLPAGPPALCPTPHAR
ncbi:hypothetical protein V2H26_17170 [Xanthomonas euvesicatoria]|nr:hypothetical protein [Xanthomonas euvesicatoria]